MKDIILLRCFVNRSLQNEWEAVFWIFICLCLFAFFLLRAEFRNPRHTDASPLLHFVLICKSEIGTKTLAPKLGLPTFLGDCESFSISPCIHQACQINSKHARKIEIHCKAANRLLEKKNKQMGEVLPRDSTVCRSWRCWTLADSAGPVVLSLYNLCVMGILIDRTTTEYRMIV